MNPEDLLNHHIKNLSNLKFGKHFFTLTEIITKTKGAVITTGIGKTGLIAKRLSHNLGAIGLQSYFCDTTSFFHGQLGILKDNDTVIVVSDSGNTEELIQFILHVKRICECKIAAILGNKNSRLINLIDEYYVTDSFNCNSISNEYPLSSHTTISVTVDILSGMILDGLKCSKNILKKYHPGINNSILIK